MNGARPQEENRNDSSINIETPSSRDLDNITENASSFASSPVFFHREKPKPELLKKLELNI